MNGDGGNNSRRRRPAAGAAAPSADWAAMRNGQVHYTTRPTRCQTPIRTVEDLALEAAIRTSTAELNVIGCELGGDVVGAFFWRQQAGIHRRIWRSALARSREVRP